MLQAPNCDPAELELEDMTLIAILKTDSYIAMAADGMGFTQGGGAHVPYPTTKLHLANSAWVFGNCGWGGVDVHRKQLEAEIARGVLHIDSDIDIGGVEYLKKLFDKCKGNMPPFGGTKLILAGCGSSGLSVKVAEVSLNEDKQLTCNLLEAPDITAYGAQEGTAKWIINTFASCCKTVDAYRDLACFAIWQVALREIMVGRLPDYAISTAIVTAEKMPIINTPDPSQLLATLDIKLGTLKQAFQGISHAS